MGPKMVPKFYTKMVGNVEIVNSKVYLIRDGIICLCIAMSCNELLSERTTLPQVRVQLFFGQMCRDKLQIPCFLMYWHLLVCDQFNVT